ncbi:hypothetical protein lbkm_1141 [Lachnospiraceae bacterium KM106-2]|nr:hypothetical protein lbkm_1141 [Lachnospiraceae bacterium KM106-2]
MKLDQLTKIKSKNSQLEYMIWESLSAAKKETDIANMSADFIINAIHMSKRKSEELAFAFNTLFEQKEEGFIEVLTFSYYISALQFWSQLTEQNAPSEEMKQVIDNVNQEVSRCKDVVFYYLMNAIDQPMLLQQQDTFRAHFNISDEYHKTLKDLLIPDHVITVQQLLVKLSNE